MSTDAEADMPSTEASGAICVQKLDDSRNSAIHIKYRISLRSSSLREPRYPLLRVVSWFVSRPSHVARAAKLQLFVSFSGCGGFGQWAGASCGFDTARHTPRLGRGACPTPQDLLLRLHRKPAPAEGESRPGQRRRLGTRARAHTAPKGGPHGGT